MKNARHIFGVHTFAPYDPITGLPIGKAKCIGNSSFAMTGEMVELYGGAQKAPWAIEDANIKTEINLTLREYPNWIYQIFMGKKPTEIAASATGTVSALKNQKGTSAMSSTTGIASVAAKVGSETSLKFGKYALEVVSPTTVHVYTMNDLDFNRGTIKQFVDESMKITASALTIASGAPVEIPGFGLELTGGSGTIAMTVGDTAVFEVLPPHEGASEVVIGGANDTFPEFGAIMVAQQRSNQEMVEIDAFRVKASGIPHQLQEKKFAEAEIKAMAFYDSGKNGIAKIRFVSPK